MDTNYILERKYNKENPNYEVKPSTIHGDGVHATQLILQGKFINNVTQEEGGYFGQTPFGKYINHSYRPNAEFRDHNSPHPLYALKDIEDGEEITVDYTKNKEFKQPQPGWKTEQYMLESYVISDKTIAIDFNKFKRGGRLFIIGLSGSGKTSISKTLSKQYRAGVCHMDNCWGKFQSGSGPFKVTEEDINNAENCMRQQIQNARGCRIVEGINFVAPQFENLWHIIMKESCIIMDKSILKSAIDAAMRDKSFLALKHTFLNTLQLHRQIMKFKKQRIKLAKTVTPL